MNDAPSRIAGASPARKSLLGSTLPRAHVGPRIDHRIHLYTVGALTDSAGVVKERYAYSAYGGRQTVVDDPAIVNDISYTGRRLDPETSLHYFRARYFDTNLGRFIGRDPYLNDNGTTKRSSAFPVAPAVGNYLPGGGYFDGMNLYGAWFVSNKLDPEGTKVICLGIGGFIGAIYGGSGSIYYCEDDCCTQGAAIIVCGGGGITVFGASAGAGASWSTGCITEGWSANLANIQGAVGPIGAGTTITGGGDIGGSISGGVGAGYSKTQEACYAIIVPRIGGASGGTIKKIGTARKNFRPKGPK